MLSHGLLRWEASRASVMEHVPNQAIHLLTNKCFAAKFFHGLFTVTAQNSHKRAQTGENENR